MVFDNPNWDFRTFDVSRDTKLAEQKIGKLVVSHDPNLEPFKKHGGKLLLYESWDEAIIPPRGLLNYYKSVLATMGGEKETKDFLRLFMIPGMGMCPGFGMGAGSTFNALDVIEKWRETGVAPDMIINTHKVDGVVDRTHPACAYPKVAVYKGSGSPYDAANFTCGNPRW
jgi:feruloyl esterase